MDDKSELIEKYERNKKRIIGNGGFCVVVAIAAFFVNPLVAILVILIGIYRVYWITKNNREIKEKIDNYK